MRIRKMPIELEAFIVDESNIYVHGPLEELPWWAAEEVEKGNIVRALPVQSPYILIHTLEGTMMAELGDYIVRGVEGEIYPIKPHIVAQSYEHLTF